MQTSNFRSFLEQKKGARDTFISNKTKLEKEIEEHNKSYNYIKEAQEILQKTAKETQNKLSFHISNFITSALQSIWEDNAYEFKLEFIEKRNKTEVLMLLKTKDGDIGLDNLNNIRSGGGVLDIVALALRVALWSLQPNKQPIMILDQPLSNLDMNHLPKAGQLIEELSSKLGIQFLMINHNPALADIADVTYEIYKEGGISKLRCGN